MQAKIPGRDRYLQRGKKVLSSSGLGKSTRSGETLRAYPGLGLWMSQ
ncbi:hypothetical protein [Nostoc sp. NMS4]|nr:hypothetical protein [Nostoc sp. NMS4]MBN3927418.1 hypothetical protein [Nostoc sp. NMS4]